MAKNQIEKQDQSYLLPFIAKMYWWSEKQNRMFIGLSIRHGYFQYHYNW